MPTTSLDRPTRPTTPAFALRLRGFWAGGFEGADHVNRHGVPLDMARASGHTRRLDEDHRRAAQAGLSCVRESIGWRLCEDGRGRIDLQRVERIAASARRHGLQVLWTVMHYGLPDGLRIQDAAFVERFARFAAAVATRLRRHDESPLYTPINEISYLAWLCADGDALGSQVSGYAVKCRLVEATLAGIAAMRGADPRARFMLVDPLVHVVPPPGQPELAARAAEIAQWQWQAWDMVTGRTEPQLGGHAAALDVVGVNHYHTSQWELDTERRLPWHLRDARRAGFDGLLDAAWQRYRRPLLVAETSHVGIGRAAWLADIADRTRAARARGVDVLGLCLYPLTDRPDWDEPQRWHRSGVWHVTRADDALPLTRVAEPQVLRALSRWQRCGLRPPPRDTVLVLANRRWDAWPAREQPALQALAGRWRVVYVEPPQPADAPALDVRAVDPCIDVVLPRLPPQASLPALLAPWLRAQARDGALVAWAPGSGAAAAVAHALRLPLLRLAALHAVDLRDFAHAHDAPGGGWGGDEVRALLAAAPSSAPLVGCLGRGGRAHGELVARLQRALPEVRLLHLVTEAAPGATVAPPLPLMPALLQACRAVLCLDSDDDMLLHALASRRPVLADGAERASPAPAWAAAVQAALAEPAAAARRRGRRQGAFLQRFASHRRAAVLDALLRRVGSARHGGCLASP